MKLGTIGISIALVIAIAGCQENPGATSSQAKQPAGTATPQPDPAIRQAQVLDQLPPVVPTAAIDLSGRKQSGKASYYARHFDGKKMADGHRFKQSAKVAASKTLPLGTTAKVTDVTTGKSAIVTVQDRGPHVDGRILDVSPSVAKQLDMTPRGVDSVVVKPIAVPKPDGGVKLGAGAAETPAPVVQDAVKTTESLTAAQ
jgi:rare lipoprotein A